MLREVRYFLEDLPASALVTFGLLVGLVLGGFATYRLTDGTPYSQSDLDRAGASRPVEVPTPVVATTDPGAELKAQRLQARLRDARTDLAAAELKSGKLRSKLDAATASLDDATTSLKVAAKQDRRAARTSETAVEGTLDVTWALDADDKPWPAGCGDVLARYRVTVDDGSEAEDPVATITGATETDRTLAGKGKDETLSLSCRGTYAVTLTGTRDARYGFSAAATDAPDQPLATVLASAADLAEGAGPALSVTR